MGVCIAVQVYTHKKKWLPGALVLLMYYGHAATIIIIIIIIIIITAC